ncbi:MAG: hypothetical protein AAGE84_29445 [Cyanobacteria bacterium P01_G01_bin.39]
MNASQESKQADSDKFFQGIGIIFGAVRLHESRQTTVEIEGETFKLKQTNILRRKLLPYLKKHPDALLYLRVYPRFNLNSQKLWFKAIAFYLDQPESTQVNQFLLAGVWQYVPQLPNQPVMSIYRNRLRAGEKVENIRANHIPLKGFTEAAYRYRPKSSTDNPHRRKFYRLLVSLNPNQGAFEYLMTLDSTEDIPPYIKKKYQPQKPSQPDFTKKVKQMNFSLLQKTALELRNAGFLEGKVSGKGVTKDALSTKVQDSLSNHPEAMKLL